MQSAKTSWIRFSTLARSPHGVTAYSDAMGEWPKNVASFIVYIQLFLAWPPTPAYVMGFPCQLIFLFH